MENIFCVDATSPIAYSQISNYLYSKLKSIFNTRPIIFLCIGTDRSTGDSLGPLIGYKLKSIPKNNVFIYGSLENPVHATNLETIINRINNCFVNPYIVAIDACLGNVQNVGKIFIEEKPLNPGLAVNKELSPIGDLSITGIVNISGSLEFMVLQNTRLYTVMTLADSISKGISTFISKLSQNSSTTTDTTDIPYINS